jgi:hypothetical protein
MEAKTTSIKQSEINIDLLIREGIENHKKLQREADEQIK